MARKTVFVEPGDEVLIRGRQGNAPAPSQPTSQPRSEPEPATQPPEPAPSGGREPAWDGTASEHSLDIKPVTGQFDTQNLVTIRYEANEDVYREHGVYVERDGEWWKCRSILDAEGKPDRLDGYETNHFKAQAWWRPAPGDRPFPADTRAVYHAHPYGVTKDGRLILGTDAFNFSIRDPKGSTRAPVKEDSVPPGAAVIQYQ